MRMTDLLFIMTHIYLMGSFIAPNNMTRLILIFLAFVFFIFSVIQGQHELKMMKREIRYQERALRRLGELNKKLEDERHQLITKIVKKGGKNDKRK